MKHLHIYILLFSVSLCYGQSQGHTHFDTEDLEEWTNSDGSITNLSLPERDPFSLRKSCDGTNSITGEMAIRNHSYFQDNYLNGPINIEMDVKNDNPFPLYLRLGFTDLEGSKIVNTNPFVVPMTTSTWQRISFVVEPSNFTLIEGSNSITEILSNTFEFYIIHNPELSFTGASEIGNLQIDNIGTLYLGIDDLKDKSVTIYPNPTKDVLYLQTNNLNIDRLEIYDSLGRTRKIESSNLQEMDLSNFASGIYYLKIFSKKGVQTQKIIKL